MEKVRFPTDTVERRGTDGAGNTERKIEKRKEKKEKKKVGGWGVLY